MLDYGSRILLATHPDQPTCPSQVKKWLRCGASPRGLQAIVLAARLAIMLDALLSMLTASRIQRMLGVTGTHVITRIFGLLLSALAVQFMFDGIAQSGILAGGS